MVEGMEEFITLFAYEGFNPEMVHEHFKKLIARKSISNEQFVNDMRALITLGALKGNYTLRNAGKISEAGRKKADELYKTYELKQGGLSGDKKAITLPRVLSAFPELTTKVIENAPERNFGVQTGPLPRFMKNPEFPAYDPKSMSSKCVETLLYLYTVYSADQSLAISRTKDFNEAFTVQSQFVTIAFNSSVPIESTRIEAFRLKVDEIVLAVLKLSDLKVGKEPHERATAVEVRDEINKLRIAK
jgi:hypothetical protein